MAIKTTCSPRWDAAKIKINMICDSKYSKKERLKKYHTNIYLRNVCVSVCVCFGTQLSNQVFYEVIVKGTSNSGF